MPEMPGDEYDVMFCFAEEDNAQLPVGSEAGWVDELVDCTAKCLGMNGLPHVRIYAQSSGHLPPIDRARLVERAATVVLILSPAYFVSEWRRNPTLADAVDGLARDAPHRVFVVEKSHVERDTAARFDVHRRSVFWRAEHEGPRTLGFPSLAAEPDPRPYFARVGDLTTTLAAQLRPAQPPTPPPPPESRLRVFLAEAAPDVEDRRLDVQRALEQAGFDVVPHGRLPPNSQQFEDEARHLIKDAWLFVQLLGTAAEAPHQVPGAVALQLRIAVGEKRPIMQWRDPSIDVMKLKDPALRDLLMRDTVHAGSIPSFCQAVKSLLPRGFVDASSDQKEQLPFIFGRYRNFRWDWHDKKPSELRSMLRSVNGVVLYWGAEASDRPVSRFYKFEELFRALNKNPRRLLIYDGPPEQKPDFKGNMEGWPVVRGRDGGEPAAFQEFLKEIANG